MNLFGIDNLPVDLAEQFLQRVIAFETAPMITDFAQLTAAAVELPESCREAGCVLITENVGDFSRIRRFIAFEFVTPWPGMALSD